MFRRWSEPPSKPKSYRCGEHLAGPMLRVRVWVLQEDSHLALPAVGLWLGRKLGRMVRASVGAKVLSLL